MSMLSQLVYVSAVTLLNIHEGKRFKRGSFRFWGCLPIYDFAAARLAGRSDDWIKRRHLGVHHGAMDILVKMIRELSKPAIFRFADGEWRSAVARVAFFMGDHIAQMKLRSQFGLACGTCQAPANELDRTDKVWPLRDSKEFLASMRRIAHECLNEAGEIIRGKLKVIKEWERDTRMRFG